MNRYYDYSRLGFNCIDQSIAATSNDKWLVPSRCTGFCTHMFEYPCEECQYVTSNVRYDPNGVHHIQTEGEESRPRWSSVLHARHN